MNNNHNQGTYKNKKQWLLRYSELSNEVERELEHAEYWRLKAVSISTPNLDNFGIRSANTQGMADYAIKFLDIAKRCEELAEEANDAKEEILKRIADLSNRDQREVLRMRYIDGLDFSEIAQKMNFSIDWIWRLHVAGLKDLEIR